MHQDVSRDVLAFWPSFVFLVLFVVRALCSIFILFPPYKQRGGGGAVRLNNVVLFSVFSSPRVVGLATVQSIFLGLVTDTYAGCEKQQQRQQHRSRSSRNGSYYVLLIGNGDAVFFFLLLFFTFGVLVANPKKLLYTVANPARGLLNREKRTKEKVWQRTPPSPPPHAARSDGKNKIKSRDASTYLGTMQVSVRLASVQGFLRLVG